MRLHSVKLINYKSMDESKYNEIIIEPNITAIIGINDSGKSNILSGLSKISFTNRIDNIFDSNNKNRNNRNASDMSYQIVLKRLPQESSLLSEDTVIKIDKNGFKATGGIVTYFLDNLSTDVNDLYEYMDTNPFRFLGNDLASFRKNCQILKVENTLDIPRITEILKKIRQWESRITSEKKEEYNLLLKSVEKKWENMCDLFPSIFYRNDANQLASEYRGDNLKKELNFNSFFLQFIQYLGFTANDILQAVSGRTDGSTSNLQEIIQDAIDEKINKKFKDFYGVEKVSLKIKFYPNVVFFTVKTDKGSSMSLGERSNGLRWYLNLFIDSQIHNVVSKNTVYLFDEPGISLHVKAQEKLLELFWDLSSKGNQIIYTTHSPFMLDTSNNGIERIRAIIKESDGNTKIYKTAYDSNIAKESRKDTLTPIIRALGMNMSSAFGPSQAKFNIITEGVSDCVYLTAIGKKLGINLSKYAFIPVFGASNLINVCTILYGWNCNFLAIFDYDKEGVEKGGNIFNDKYNYFYNEFFIYLKDASQKEIESKTYLTSPVTIEDLVFDRKEFVDQNDYSGLNKTLIAKFYKTALEEGTFECKEKTLNNFKNLFERIDECINKQKRIF